MKKIIGSVLIVICLSQPAHMLKNAASNSELLQIQQFYVKKVSDELAKMNSSRIEENDRKVQSLIATLHNNTRKITKLLKDKTDTITTVQSIMNEKVKTRKRMTDEQIQIFNDFTHAIETENPKVQTALVQINELKDMKEVQQQIMMDEMNYKTIQDNLNQIIQYQTKAIAGLNRVVQSGNYTIGVLA